MLNYFHFYLVSLSVLSVARCVNMLVTGRVLTCLPRRVSHDLTSSHTLSLRAEDHSEVSAANGPSLITASRLNSKMYTINKYIGDKG